MSTSKDHAPVQSQQKSSGIGCLSKGLIGIGVTVLSLFFAWMGFSIIFWVVYFYKEHKIAEKICSLATPGESVDEFVQQVKKETDRADALMDSRELTTKESYEECIHQYRKVSTHEEGLRMCPEPGDADKGYIRYVTPTLGPRWFCEVRFDEKKVTYKRFFSFFD